MLSHHNNLELEETKELLSSEEKNARKIRRETLQKKLKKERWLLSMLAIFVSMNGGLALGLWKSVNKHFRALEALDNQYTDQMVPYNQTRTHCRTLFPIIESRVCTDTYCSNRIDYCLTYNTDLSNSSIPTACLDLLMRLCSLSSSDYLENTVFIVSSLLFGFSAYSLAVSYYDYYFHKKLLSSQFADLTDDSDDEQKDEESHGVANRDAITFESLNTLLAQITQFEKNAENEMKNTSSIIHRGKKRQFGVSLFLLLAEIVFIWLLNNMMNSTELEQEKNPIWSVDFILLLLSIIAAPGFGIPMLIDATEGWKKSDVLAKEAQLLTYSDDLQKEGEAVMSSLKEKGFSTMNLTLLKHQTMESVLSKLEFIKKEILDKIEQLNSFAQKNEEKRVSVVPVSAFRPFPPPVASYGSMQQTNRANAMGNGH
jgi:hypothetical protein